MSRGHGRKRANPVTPNPAPVTASPAEPVAPVRARRRWLWLLVLFLAGIGILTELTRPTKPSPIAAKPLPAETVSPAVTNMPMAVIETNAPAPESNSFALPPQPRLQGIVFDSARPWAIVDGKTVYPGDRVGNLRVKVIAKGALTLEDTNGLRQVLVLGR